MNARARAPAGLLAAALAAGCVTARAGVPPDLGVLVPGTATKAEVYRTLGLPTEIEIRGGEEVLQYDARESRGSAFGVTGYGVQLMVRNVNVGTNRLEVRLDDAGIVRDVRYFPGTYGLRSSLWPFGD